MLPPHKTRNSYSDFGIQFVPKDKISHRANIIIKAGFRGERGEGVSPKLFYIPYQTFQKEENFPNDERKDGENFVSRSAFEEENSFPKIRGSGKLHSSIACQSC
ncbi:hypothetical protein TNIN_193151 [Trichonephila inaurata madagascariensis]|uniref:Uncharacterized protein n=1 Tax=Trichonephila inaurata madagascariensis TaxID=2747483 RepID=A0A8X6JQS0_9ARAC|nr:hypothetical protein TNIN_193151 [Trichonephila inaurata madagascariensis]